MAPKGGGSLPGTVLGLQPMLAAAGLAVGIALLPEVAPAAPRGEPATSLAMLAEEYAGAERDLVRRCQIAGLGELAAVITAWQLPEAAGRQFAFAIPAALEPPAGVDADPARSIWSDFLAARRARAAGTFAHALFAAAAYDRQPTPAELAHPDPDPPPLPRRSAEVIRLLFLVLRDDPDHERARAALGWVRRRGRWEWPEAARRLDKGEAFDAEFGWLPKGRLARYRAGERYAFGRWVKAADDDARPREVRDGRQFNGDHWEIVSTAPPAATGELAAALEAVRLVWLQVFGAFALEPADLEKRLTGRARLPPQTAHSAILCGSREQYLAELRQLDPRIAMSDGLYWLPTRTIWCFAAPAGLDLPTVRHEGFHQLFAESRGDLFRLRAEPGGRAGFWAVEAAALYAESITATEFGWTIGGPDAGRAAAARRLLAADGWSLPLAELTSLGREAFQAHDRIADLYDQCGGLADFFMNAADGRYRESFIVYLNRVYAGIAEPDTIARLCRKSYPELDAEYREYMR